MRRTPWDPATWSVDDAVLNDASLPFITLGVLNYNRREALRQTLDVLVHAVQYPRYEIIVIDNGSTDGSVEMVRSEYPSVNLHPLPDNRGVSSRNIQAEIATGKYLFSFDDDTYPATPAMVLQIVKYLEHHAHVSAVCGQVYQPVTGIEEMQDWDRYISQTRDVIEILSPAEGAVCFRLSILKQMEGYEPRFIYGAEGRELALQFYKHGYTLWYAPSFATLHFPPIGRTPHTRAYLQWRHTIWIFAKHWPKGWLPLLITLWTLRRAIGAILHPNLLGVTIKGWWEGLTGMGPFLKYHPKLTHKQAMSLGRFYLQLFRW
jgi:GT2 family glycosyltransferase